MHTSQNGGRDATAHAEQSFGVPLPSAALLDVRGVALLLGCSSRHVYRLSDGGKMPSPLRIGALVRWNRAAVEDWISRGCPSVRSISSKGGR